MTARDTLIQLVQEAEHMLLKLGYRLEPTEISTKSINEVLREYNDTLTRWAYSALNGRMGETDVRRAHKALLRSISKEMYLEGMREGDAEEEDFDNEDRNTIDGWMEGQLDAVDGFAEFLAEKNDEGELNWEGKRREIATRIGLWVSALATLGGLGAVSARRNQPAVWVLGDTEKHCPTCLKLDGQRHRVQWFISRNFLPRTPGADMYCGGYRCDCSIEHAKTGEVLFPR